MTGFTTARLSASPITPADLPFLLALWSDNQVAKTLGGPRSAGQTERILGEDIRHNQRNREPSVVSSHTCTTPSEHTRWHTESVRPVPLGA